MLKVKPFYLACFDHHHQEENHLCKESSVQVLLFCVNCYYNINQETRDKFEYYELKAKANPVIGRGDI
jgi:hypothetical protein